MRTPSPNLWHNCNLKQGLRGGKLAPWQQTLFRTRDSEDNTNSFDCFPVFGWPDPDSKWNVRGESMRPGAGKELRSYISDRASDCAHAEQSSPRRSPLDPQTHPALRHILKDLVLLITPSILEATSLTTWCPNGSQSTIWNGLWLYSNVFLLCHFLGGFLSKRPGEPLCYGMVPMLNLKKKSGTPRI